MRPLRGFPQKENDTKLRSEDIAYTVKAMLEMDDRGFLPELSVFATNPVRLEGAVMVMGARAVFSKPAPVPGSTAEKATAAGGARVVRGLVEDSELVAGHLL